MGDIRAGADVLRPVYEATQRARRLYQPRMLALSRQRHRGDAGRSAAAVEGGRARQPDGQGAGTAGGHSGDPHADRRRAEHQRHVAVRHSGLREGGGSLHRRPREIWRNAGGDVSRVASVASFFVSRIDTLVDKRIDAAIAARAATRRRWRRCAARWRSPMPSSPMPATRRCSPGRAGRRWQRRARGTQRLLWASTSTKNPAYPDTLYVDTLIGRDTVNTMPPATMDAFRDHGHVEAGCGGEGVG